MAKAGTSTRSKASGDGGSDDALKRERAGTYLTKDGRFTVEQSSSGWMLFDAEQTNELGLPLAHGPFATLDAAREAIPEVRARPAPSTEVQPRRAPRKPPVIGPPAREQARPARRAPRRPDPAQLVIREIRTADGDALRALWKEAGLVSVGDDDRSLARLARRNPGLALVATESARIVGSALGAWDGRRGWIYHVATAKSHRRRGIAKRLIAEVERGLRDLDCPKINVLVRESNDDGAAFWEELGYEAGTGRQFSKALAAE